MKILIISTSERIGGAAVAAGRLMHALQANGMEASMLVRDSDALNPSVKTVSDSILKKIPFLFERLTIFIANRFRKKNLFEVSTANFGFDITKRPEFKEADIIHLHWVNQGLLSLKNIRQVVESGKQIVWTMHDMWPLTGICHYSGECHRFDSDCGNCPLLLKPVENDLSRRIFLKKERIYLNAGIQFVSCSEWLLQQVRTSKLVQGNPLSQIPNPIDTDLFQPGDVVQARQKLGLPLNKKIILFGAYSITDQRKGIRYLIEATHQLADLKDRVELVFCGVEKQELIDVIGLNTRSLGYISDQSTMVSVYQAVDCFVIPSLEENLPNMIMEAMACGVPCVGFRTGGIPEMIIHGETGYIADYKSSEDLAKGIRSMVSPEETPFRKTVRSFVLEHYSENAVAEKYRQIYEKKIHKK
ncbi:MAG TPA: glycosyltransferase family 4 protein [Bacteroidales bacterium]|nr:glycosyltransferase family 4 protein [Bacteroidales bacterium]